MPLRKALHIVQIADQLAKYCYPHADVMEIDQIPADVFELLNLDPSISKLLEKPVRDAISRAIFFADGNSRRPSALPRRFLRPLRGIEAANAAASAQNTEPRVAIDEDLVGKLFSQEVPEIFNNNGAKSNITGQRHARFSTSATSAGIQKCISAIKAHQDELNLNTETRSISAMTIKSFMANLQSLCGPTELIEIAQMVETRKMVIGIRAPAWRPNAAPKPHPRPLPPVVWPRPMSRAC